jgi:hypothetical protein
MAERSVVVPTSHIDPKATSRSYMGRSAPGPKTDMTYGAFRISNDPYGNEPQ